MARVRPADLLAPPSKNAFFEVSALTNEIPFPASLCDREMISVEENNMDIELKAWLLPQTDPSEAEADADWSEAMELLETLDAAPVHSPAAPALNKKERAQASKQKELDELNEKLAEAGFGELRERCWPTLEDVEVDLQRIANSRGFSFTKADGKKNSEGEFLLRTFSCRNAREPKGKQSARTDCQCHVNLSEGGKRKVGQGWRMLPSSSFVHNHPMKTPEEMALDSSQRGIPDDVETLVRGLLINAAVSISSHTLNAVITSTFPQYEKLCDRPWLDYDMLNLRRRIKDEQLSQTQHTQCNDLLCRLMEMQADDPEFYFKIATATGMCDLLNPSPTTTHALLSQCLGMLLVQST